MLLIGYDGKLSFYQCYLLLSMYYFGSCGRGSCVVVPDLPI